MIQTPKIFQVDQLYSNEEIYSSLGVGNAGGIRIKYSPLGNVKRAVLFTSIPTSRQLLENPDKDHIAGDVLVYTGTGRSGDQAISEPNSRFQQQAEHGFPIDGFAQASSRGAATGDSKRWRFPALLELLRCNREQQLDAVGQWRSACIFEFFAHSAATEVAVDVDQAAADLARTTGDWKLKPLDQEIPEQATKAGSATGAGIDMLEPIRKRPLAFEPRQFGLFVRDLLIRTGFEQVEVARFSQDGGINANARLDASVWAVQNLLVQIQAKRWLHTVGRGEVAQLRGSVQPHTAGCIVTTSQFSCAALVESRAPGKVPITVINSLELAGLTHAANMALDRSSQQTACIKPARSPSPWLPRRQCTRWPRLSSHHAPATRAAA
jgi:hypothetical protein